MLLALVVSVLFTGGCSAVAAPGPEGHLESKQSREKETSRLEPEISRETESTVSAKETEPSAVEIPAGGSELPSRYDARTDGRTAPVKNQGDLGTCWAFASLLALESSLLPEESYDFSEDHMSHDPNFLLDQKSGGDYIMSMAYLLSWRGPVLEEEDPYGDGISPEGLTAVKHVQEIQILPEYDRDAIKTAVYRTGGVQSALYTTLQGQQDSRYYKEENGAYYYSGTLPPNHDVVIVGWRCCTRR